MNRWWMNTLTLAVAAVSVLLTPGSLGWAEDSGEQKAQVIGPQDPKMKAQYRDVANELRCPMCTSVSVLESHSPFAEQIKSMVEQQVKDGKSRTEILAFFEERYGSWILRAPPKRGLSLLAWVLPGVCFLVGPLVVFLFARRRRSAPGDLATVRPMDTILVEFFQLVDAERTRRGSRG